jgi:hypothetical protein
VVWCGVVWCGVVWCGVVWCGVVWCGVVWCGVVCHHPWQMKLIHHGGRQKGKTTATAPKAKSNPQAI